MSLDEALGCVRHAGIDDPDEVLLERLGAAVVRADLFGEARVYLSAVDQGQALSQ